MVVAVVVVASTDIILSEMEHGFLSSTWFCSWEKGRGEGGYISSKISLGPHSC